jgi:hypothetical protein
VTEWQRVTIESDARGRITINAFDANGAGHGYRLAGPKCVDDYVSGKFAKTLAVVELTDHDVREIRSYLAIWDGIQAAKLRASGDS